ncbi:MAG: hypothetical protein GY774_32755 [Planctomycetes bacterium]|nr:hypothetical protein [Planctomycetota bacterium]
MNTTEQIILFTKLILGPKDLCQVDTFRGNQVGPRLWKKTEKIGELADELTSLNQQGYNVYLGVGARKLKKKESKTDNVSHCRVLFIDFDSDKVPCDGPLLVELKNRVDRHKLPKPSFVVNSGNGYHAYWLLKEPMTNMAAWLELQKRLTKTMGSDEGILTIPRIMRVPGFDNVKDPSKPKPCYLQEKSEVSYNLEDIVPHLKEIKSKASNVSTNISDNDNLTQQQTTALECLKVLDPSRVGNYPEWIKVGIGLHHCGFDWLTWDKWSQQSSKYQKGVCEQKWGTFDSQIDQPLTVGTLVNMAKEDNHGKLPENIAKMLHSIRSLKSFPWTDSGAAERLAELYSDKLRYCYGISWMYFNGKYWDKKRGEAMARTLCKKAARALRKEALNVDDLDERAAIEKYARTLEQSHRITATLKEAQHTAPFESYPDDYDSDNWAFNVNNGTVDLRTGKLQPHNSADMITRCAQVNHDEKAMCPLWEKALLEIFKDNEVLVSYVQRISGMCLTGDIREQILLVFYGTGRNGKNVELDTVAGLMGDYACEAAPTLLTSRSGFDEHPTEIADLCGRRLVIACETKQGGILKADTVKRLTGNARIKARFMREDYFEFDRTFKIILCTNHRPEVPEKTIAIWERLKVVPFNRFFTEAERDKLLTDKLKTERPGILNWMVRGCLDWQKNGLQEPDEIVEATGEYQESQNPLDDFFEQCCKFNAFSVTPVSILKEHFAEYEGRIGRELQVSTQIFNQELRKRGCKYDTQYYGGQTQKVWCGIDLC